MIPIERYVAEFGPVNGQRTTPTFNQGSKNKHRQRERFLFFLRGARDVRACLQTIPSVLPIDIQRTQRSCWFSIVDRYKLRGHQTATQRCYILMQQGE